jgi:hypothetical protein
MKTGTTTYSYGGYPLDNNDNQILSGVANPNYDMRPIIVTFTTGGAVDQVYCTRWMPSLGKWTWFGRPTAAQVHLLIGKAEYLPIGLSPTGNPVITGSAGIIAQQNTNLTDLDNFWVTITPTNGDVSTVPNSYQAVALTSPGTLSGVVNVDAIVRVAHNLGETGFLMGGK